MAKRIRVSSYHVKAHTKSIFHRSAASSQQQAYTYLQDLIVSGALAGGTRLRPEVIAAELGISRMPVREAIRQLDAEGYVTIRLNRGAIVTSRSREEVIELFEIRAALEGLALRLAAGHVSDEALSDLELELQRLRAVATDSASWLVRHDDFHDRLCATAARPQLQAECHRHRLAVRPYGRLYLKTGRTFEQPGFEHEMLIDALRRGDGELAERAAREHILANAHAIADCLPEQGAPAASVA
jgi:DNA-binding GntR family transcriptional regulator